VTAPSVGALACPSCGGPITLRGFELSLTVVCPSCHAVLDARDPNLKVLQAASQRMSKGEPPKIPLGTRAPWRGAPYEVIGYQIRQITVEGIAYAWREYLLFNPFYGFRYLTEYDGHWNDAVVTRHLPFTLERTSQPIARLDGTVYRHFQTANAVTSFALGEFPWEVHVGDRATVTDYVAPPRMLSREVTEDESVWSIGTYVMPDEIWRAFKLPGAPPLRRGVYENQPSPYAGLMSQIGSLSMIFAILLCVLSAVLLAVSRREQVFAGDYVARMSSKPDTAFVTPSFDIHGRTAGTEVSIRSDVSNSWEYFNLALINEGTGKAIDFGREVSYYYGADSDGPWTEGSMNDRAIIPAVPPGRYYLLIQPEGPGDPASVSYSITLTHDVPSLWPLVIALGLLALGPAILIWRNAAFETARWRESDHAPSDS
jgi:hypothetical protein